MENEVTGLIEQLHKKVVIDDMTFILTTIFENTKFWEFKNITEEKLASATNKGLKIFEIKVDSVIFSTKPEDCKLTLDAKTFEINLSSDEPVLTYLLSFKWEATSLGVHIGFGKGIVEYKGKKLSASYNPVNPESKLSVSGIPELKSITGKGILNSGIEAWIRSRLDNLRKDLEEGMKYNKSFLHTYMHFKSKQFRNILKGGSILDYNGKIFKVIENNDYYTYLYKVELELDNQFLSEVSFGIEPTLEKSHDVSFHIPSQYIPLTIDAYGRKYECDEDVDPKSLGLTGTVKDLFVALPELYSIYNGSETIKMYCMYGHEGVNIGLPNNRMELPATCNFTVENKTVLSSNFEFNMIYEPTVENHIFKTKMREVSITKCATEPQSMTAAMFLINIFDKLRRNKFTDKILNTPKVSYTPRDLSKFNAESIVVNGKFVSRFKYKNNS